MRPLILILFLALLLALYCALLSSGSLARAKASLRAVEQQTKPVPAQTWEQEMAEIERL